MAKVHRMYHHSWWIDRFQKAGMFDDALGGMFGTIAFSRRDTERRYILPFLRYRGDGDVLQVPWTQKTEPSEQNTAQQYQRRLEQNRAKREQEHGIPGGVEDALDWYYAYLKLADMRDPEKQVPKTKDDKEAYYREIIVNLYYHSGYSYADSLDIAYSAQGDELIRYLSDDKRHSLNRNREDEIDEVCAALE